MRDLQAGDRLAHFQVLSLLGKGGMGSVYLARDLKLQRDVALKVLPPASVEDPVLRTRFLLEARATASLSHPGIATVYEVGEDAGVEFIAMEQVRGDTLRRLIDRAGGAGLGILRAAEYARQTAEALASAHAAGFIHRDIKPENLMVTPDGQVKVLDFGLALRLGPGGSAASGGAVATRLTGAGRVAGTLAYMAPEQIRGESLDPRVDVYAMGAVLYEMTHGCPPFVRATAAETVRAILREPPPAVKPGVEPAVRRVARLRGQETVRARRMLRRVFDRALAKEPASRYATASDMASDLAQLQSRRPGRFGLPLGIALAALLVIAVGTAYLVVSRLPERARRPADSSAASSLRVMPVLVRPGADETPDVSRDGSRLAFSRGGNLFVMDLKGSGSQPEPRVLTTGSERDDQPDWSPNGETILFTRDRPDGGTEIWSIPAAGGAPRRVVLNASDPSWSPDGERFAFVQKGLGRSTSILTVGADGTLSRPVTRPEDAFFHYMPAWSPDGATIAFVKDAGGGASSDIWLVPAEGGSARQLTREPSGIFSTEPAWSADGAWVLYASNRGGTRNIWKIPAGGGEPVRVTAGPGEDGDPSASGDGRRIFYTTSRRQSGLFVRTLASGADRELTLDSVAVLWGPAFSPDGESIAYTRIDPGGEWALFVTPLEGGLPRKLTPGGASALWPRWSPDGSRIVYCTFSKDDDDLFVIPAGGGPSRRLTEEGGDDWWPVWTPDGRSIVFSRSEEETTHLYRVAPEGGRPIRLSDQAATLPDVSPDGTLIAVARDRGFWHGVGVMPASGGSIRWLTDTGGWPVFRSDGRSVGFIRLEPGARQSIWEVPVGGGEARPIEGPRFRGWNLPFDFSPEGTLLAYTNDLADETDVWGIEIR